MRLQKDINAHLERSKWKTEMLRVCVTQLSHLLCQYTSYKHPRHSVSNVQCCSIEISRGYDFSSSRNGVLSRRRQGLETKAYVTKITQKLTSNLKQELQDRLSYAHHYCIQLKNIERSKLWILCFSISVHIFKLEQFNSLVTKEPGVMGLFYCRQLSPVGLTLMIITSSNAHFFQL